MKRLLLPFIFVIFSSGMLFIPLNAMAASDETVKTDTSNINKLFKKGYEFINGPSDSLLFYFGKALLIINKNLDEAVKGKDVNKEEVDLFKKLKIRVYIEFGIENFFKSDYLSALDHYYNALTLAEELDDPEILSECYSEIGIVLKNQGKLDEALKYYNKSLQMARLGTDTSWIASCLVNIGNVYKEKEFLIISLGYYLDALKTLESINHTRRVAACYENIGDLYSKQKDFDNALTFFNKALELASQSNDKVRETACFLNIGYVYAQRKDYVTARQFYDKALEFYLETGYSHKMDDCYILIGNTWLDEGEKEKALSYYLKAEKISQQEQDHKGLSEIYCKLGKTYFLLNKQDLAEKYCLLCLDMAKHTSSIETESDAHAILSDIFAKKGSTIKALQHYKKYSQLKDSIFNAQKYLAITEMQIKYETEKKEQQIALYKGQAEVQKLKNTQKNRMMLVLALGTFMLLVILYLLYRQSKLKTLRKQAVLEQKLLRSQMKPHFIFNSLIAIQSYIYKNEATLAGDYLARFAALIRFTLESSRNEFLALEKEINMMQVYLDLQKLRFENHFDYKLTIAKNLEVESLSIPPMFAQPFVENAIEHGLRHHQSGGLIEVSYEQIDASCIRITVRDNGIGRTKAKEMNKNMKHHSMATEIARERLAILSKKFKKDYRLRIKDLKDESGRESGVEVAIDIPIR